MSRIPTAAPTSAAPTSKPRVHRVHRVRHVPRPKPAPAVVAETAAAPAPEAAAAPEAQPVVRKAVVHHRKRPAARRIAHRAPPPAAAPAPPTYAQAARAATEPASWTLISSTICETSPSPRLAMARAPSDGSPSDEAPSAAAPAADDIPPTALLDNGPGLELPGILGPGGGPIPGGGVSVLTPGGGGQPGVPGGGGPTGPTAPVPEPAAWLLMILGFGAIGGSLRRRGARTVEKPLQHP